MDDGELAVTNVLAKRCLDTGMPVGSTKVYLFALSISTIACKLQRDDAYTLEQVAAGSGFGFDALHNAEWYAFGWLLDHSKLAVSPSECAVAPVDLADPADSASLASLASSARPEIPASATDLVRLVSSGVSASHLRCSPYLPLDKLRTLFVCFSCDKQTLGRDDA